MGGVTAALYGAYTDMSNQHIKDEGDLRKYRTEIPNMADDELDPFEYRLYAHYKRVCGANDGGLCYESVRTTAEITKMGIGTVSETRYALAEKGWIEIHISENGQQIIVTISDRWLENFARYAPDQQLEKLGISRSLHERTVHKANGQKSGVVRDDLKNCSPHETKKELKDSLEERTNKERTTPQPPALIDQPAAGGANSGGGDGDYHPFRDLFVQEGFGDWTPGSQRHVDQAVDEFGETEVYEFFRIAVSNNVHKWSYIDGIMNRRRAEIAEAQQWADYADGLGAETEPDPEPAAEPEYPPDHPVSIWNTAYAHLGLQMPREAYETWLRGATLVAYEDGTYVLGVPNIYAQQWLDHRLKSVVVRTLSQIAQRAVEVRFVLDQSHRTIGEQAS